MGGSETTFRVEAEHWLRHHGALFSPGYLKKARGVLRELDGRQGDLSPDDLHPGLLAEVQQDELAKGLSPKTVNHKLQIVSAVLNFSARSRRIHGNPALGLQKLKGPKPAMQFWELAEAKAFLAFADTRYPFGSEKRWVYVAYLTALNTGIRAGELLGVQPRDLVQGGELLHIQRQFDRVSRTCREPKGKRSRYVPCNVTLRAELQDIIQRRAIGRVQPIGIARIS